MSDAVVLIYEVEPHPATEMHVQPDSSMQKGHDPGPYSDVAPKVEAHRISASAEHVPWTQNNSRRRKKQCRVRRRNADVRDEVAPIREQAPQYCRAREGRWKRSIELISRETLG